MGAVIASRGDRQLSATLDSLEKAWPGLRRLVVDDSDLGLSPFPEGVEWTRGPCRLGCARSRHLGASVFLNSPDRPDLLLFTDDHMAFCGDDPRPENPALRATDGCLQAAAAVAWSTGGIAYVGCNNHSSAAVTKNATTHNVWRCTWDRDYPEPTPSRGLMGAGYIACATALDKMGGWPALAGWIGWDEEAVSIIAHRVGVPITYVPGFKTWHDFRGAAHRNREYQPRYDRYQVSLASLYRICFDDAHWAQFRRHLGTVLKLDATDVPIPEHVLAEVESDEMLAYGESVRARFQQTDDKFLREWNA